MPHGTWSLRYWVREPADTTLKAGDKGTRSVYLHHLTKEQAETVRDALLLNGATTIEIGDAPGQISAAIWTVDFRVRKAEEDDRDAA